MTANLSVEDALNLREGDPPEESWPLVDGDQASAEGGQEIAPIEGETEQLGIGSSEEAEVVDSRTNEFVDDVRFFPLDAKFASTILGGVFEELP
ncbi:unnamed protein product [Cochlearia groenlandica]